ncbi:MAG: adenosine deaminase [Bacillota bacterium]
MSKVKKEFIQGIPKAELHIHLEGSLEPELKLKLAQKNNIDLGMDTVEAIRATYQFDDLSSFLDVYYQGMEVLQDREDFYNLAMEYFKTAKKHNVKYAEVFFDPQAHTTRGVAFAEVIEGYYKATKDAKKLGITANLIMCFLRDMSAESALEHYQMAKPYQDWILGIGLDSDERDNPPLKFAKLFEMAKNDGYQITMHCDIDQKDSIKHIEDVLYKVKTSRIDHGTNIIENQSLVDYAIENEIGFTKCPVSNRFVTGDLKAKEIKSLLDQGAKVTINSDDPAYFQSYISDDIYTLAQAAELTKAEIIQLAKNSFEVAWISEAEKKNYLAQIAEYLEKQA